MPRAEPAGMAGAGRAMPLARGALGVVQANSANLRVAENLLRIAEKLDREEVKTELRAEIDHILDNVEAISTALRQAQLRGD